jgi:hypothetical protein
VRENSQEWNGAEGKNGCANSQEKKESTSIILENEGGDVGPEEGAQSESGERESCRGTAVVREVRSRW